MPRHQMRTVFEGEEDTCDTIKTKAFLIHFQVGSSWSETRREGEGRRRWTFIITMGRQTNNTSSITSFMVSFIDIFITKLKPYDSVVLHLLRLRCNIYIYIYSTQMGGLGKCPGNVLYLFSINAILFLSFFHLYLLLIAFFLWTLFELDWLSIIFAINRSIHSRWESFVTWGAFSQTKSRSKVKTIFLSTQSTLFRF